MIYKLKRYATICIALSFLFVSSCLDHNVNCNQECQDESADYIHDEILSYENARRDSILHLYLNTKDHIDEEEAHMKCFFFEHGEDSLLIMPGFALVNLFYSRLEGYKYKYFTYQQFKDSFLTSKQHLKALEDWSIHKRKNNKILNDYEKLSFNEFFKKYCYIEHGDTFAIANDATLSFCLDKHSLYCDVLPLEDYPEIDIHVYKRTKIK